MSIGADVQLFRSDLGWSTYARTSPRARDTSDAFDELVYCARIEGEFSRGHHNLNYVVRPPESVGVRLLKR